MSEVILGFDVKPVPGGKRGVFTAVSKMTGKLRTIIIPSEVGKEFDIEDMTVGGKSAFREGGPPVPAVVFSENAWGSIKMNVRVKEGDEVSLMVTNKNQEERNFMAAMIWVDGDDEEKEESAKPGLPNIVESVKGTIQPGQPMRFVSPPIQETKTLRRLILICEQLASLRVTNIEVDGKDQLVGSVGPEGVGLPAAVYHPQSFPPRLNFAKGNEFAVVLQNDTADEVGIEILFVLE